MIVSINSHRPLGHFPAAQLMSALRDFVDHVGMLLMMRAGWVNRQQQDVIVYLKEENKILREKLGANS